MSWDIDLIDTKTNETIEGWNYTHNCNIMINTAIKDAGIAFTWYRDMMNCDGPYGAFILDTVIKSLEADPVRFDEMNPENGWGDRESLVKVLTEMRDAVPERLCHWEAWG